MEEETITYELIRKIQREEQASTKLTKLPENFFDSVASYLEKKRSVEEKDRRAVLEIKNIERLVEDIFNRRERKIINFAIIAARTNIPPENLLEKEKEFYQKLVEIIKERRDKELKKILRGEKKEMVTLVIFKEAVPQFVGADGRSYGPFEKGDIAKLPEANVKILLEKKLVEEMKVEK
jgi:DNA replication initiation complex subunit (GINS family)